MFALPSVKVLIKLFQKFFVRRRRNAGRASQRAKLPQRRFSFVSFSLCASFLQREKRLRTLNGQVATEIPAEKLHYLSVGAFFERPRANTVRPYRSNICKEKTAKDAEKQCGYAQGRISISAREKKGSTAQCRERASLREGGGFCEAKDGRRMRQFGDSLSQWNECLSFVPQAPPFIFSLRLGHARVLTPPRGVIHCARAASLPPGGGRSYNHTNWLSRTSCRCLL